MLEQAHKELAESRTAHVRDLRVLLDEAVDREKRVLPGIAPKVTESAPKLRIVPVSDTDYLNDVAIFDENGDEEIVKTQDDLNRKFRQLYEEQHASEQA